MGVEIAVTLLDALTDSKVKELLELRPWMKHKRFLLLTKQTEIEAYIYVCIQKGRCVYDLETTGLNTRVNSEGKCYTEIVGICLSHDPDEGVYIPVAHISAEDYNVSLSFILRETARLAANCVLIFHNFKYDGQILRTYGITIDREDRYEDTYLMAAIEDASRKEKGLKVLSESLLGRPQLEINELGIQTSKKNVVAFNLVPPQKAVYYGASDGMNTMALYLYLKDKIDKQDPKGVDGPWAIYKIEKRCLIVTMEMERNLVLIDKDYLKLLDAEVTQRMEKMVKKIFALVGHEFDINSTQQLGVILFDEMKLPYPKKVEKSKTGHYLTNSEVLEMVGTKNPIIDLILTYRGYVKIQSTYLYNWLINADENNEVKFQLNQVQADTGRYSGSGGRGLHDDGYCGVNCQNIPKFDEKDPHAVNLRKAMIAHKGFKMLSIDYSGEELRIATNFSREPKWVNEFLHGTGDLHTITAQIITGKSEVSKKERGVGKTLNFLTLYGGGAGGFAAQAKISYETAKKMIVNFFKEYVGLNAWIKREAKVSRKRGYSRTAFGRRRPLTEFYNSEDKGIQAKGDRCAVNSAVQGSGADVIKIALWRVYKWIKDNNLQDDIKILLPVHDEILFEVREDKLDMLVPELCQIMKIRDVTDKLKWVVPLDVDAEYGDTFDVDHNYWEELKEKHKAQPIAMEPVLKVEAPVVSEESKQLEAVSAPNDVGVSTTTSATENYYLNYSVKNMLTDGIEAKEDAHAVLNRTEENVSETLFKDAHIKDRIDERGYFYYPMDINPVSARQMRFILETLRAGGDSLFIGQKNKLCILSKDGEVFYKSSEELSVDAFLALCLVFNI